MLSTCCPCYPIREGRRKAPLGRLSVHLAERFGDYGLSPVAPADELARCHRHRAAPSGHTDLDPSKALLDRALGTNPRASKVSDEAATVTASASVAPHSPTRSMTDTVGLTAHQESVVSNLLEWIQDRLASSRSCQVTARTQYRQCRSARYLSCPHPGSHRDPCRWARGR